MGVGRNILQPADGDRLNHLKCERGQFSLVLAPFCRQLLFNMLMTRRICTLTGILHDGRIICAWLFAMLILYIYMLNMFVFSRNVYFNLHHLLFDTLWMKGNNFTCFVYVQINSESSFQWISQIVNINQICKISLDINNKYIWHVMAFCNNNIS